MDNELLLFDRLEVIKSINQKYDLDHNAYISFSGGKDSTVLHYLIDLALPNNRIPRVFINTGIEYNYIVEFVKELGAKDDRFIILKPTLAIKPMLEKYGYPFKSKEHSLKVGEYQKGSKGNSIIKYKENAGKQFGCPLLLLYQFEDSFQLKLSDKCCYKLKKEPVKKWEKENNKLIAITGMRKEEGGQRANIKGCILTDKDGNLKKFHPLLVVNESFENYVIDKYKLQLCKLYYPPFNFKRAGCKCCPLSLDLQEQLIIMEKYLPNEKRQCELIWKPVYDEYRRLNYRLKKYEQLTLFDLFDI
jgi:3'-phosphoadenosine 5'-phosphosulfate sulfotransferase (PAPS reductase)/FAD synthetase